MWIALTCTPSEVGAMKVSEQRRDITRFRCSQAMGMTDLEGVDGLVQAHKVVWSSLLAAEVEEANRCRSGRFR